MTDEQAQALRPGQVVWVQSERRRVGPRQAEVLGVEVRPFAPSRMHKRHGSPETYTAIELLLDGDLWYQTPTLLSLEEPKP